VTINGSMWILVMTVYICNTETFRQINNLKINEKIYLFLDEVTYKDSFKTELKNLYNLEHTKIFATNSSANKLIDKKAQLTERSRTVEANLSDFKEFLIFKNINL